MKAETVELGEVCDFTYGDGLKEEKRRNGKVPVYGSNGIVGWHDQAITAGPTIVVGRKGSIGEVNWSNKPCFPIDTTYYIEKTKIPCDLRWLYYALLKLDLTRLNKSAAVPGLNRDDAYEQRIIFPSTIDQKKVADCLDQADRLRYLHRYALEMSESFLKAMFIKLFGDPYASKRSDVACLQDIAIINPAIKPTLDDREELSFVPMSDVDEKNGEIVGAQIRKYGDVKKGYTAFENGDVLFAKITPCMENGKSAIAKNLRNSIGFGSTEWHVLRPTPRTNSEWLLGLVRLDSVRQNAARRFVGSAGQQRVPEDFLAQLMVSVPYSADLEQYKVMCNRHETLIHTNQEALRQAEHLFQSLLHQAFSEN